MEDAENIIHFLKKCKKALVVGGGAIGLEVGFALREQDMEVSVVEEAPSLLPNTLDKEMAKIVEDHLKERRSFLRKRGYKSMPSRNVDISYWNKAGYNLYQKKVCDAFDLFSKRT